MSNLIYESTLYHHGIKGQKWGVRRFQNKDGSWTSAGAKRYGEGGTRTGSRSVHSNNKISGSNEKLNGIDNDAKIRQRRKRALKIGAAVVGTALAAYGVYKVSSYVKDKRNSEAMKKASEYVKNNFMEKVGSSKLSDGRIITDYANIRGDGTTQFRFEGARNKAMGDYNARVVSKGREIYKNATNTKFDRGLNKIVGAGEAVGRFKNNAGEAAVKTANRAKESIKNNANIARNRVLDVVNPVYENVPVSTKSNVRNLNGLKITENVTTYRRKKKRR